MGDEDDLADSKKLKKKVKKIRLEIAEQVEQLDSVPTDSELLLVLEQFQRAIAGEKLDSKRGSVELVKKSIFDERRTLAEYMPFLKNMLRNAHYGYDSLKKIGWEDIIESYIGPRIKYEGKKIHPNADYSIKGYSDFMKKYVTQLIRMDEKWLDLALRLENHL